MKHKNKYRLCFLRDDNEGGAFMRKWIFIFLIPFLFSTCDLIHNEFDPPSLKITNNCAWDIELYINKDSGAWKEFFLQSGKSTGVIELEADTNYYISLEDGFSSGLYSWDEPLNYDDDCTHYKRINWSNVKGYYFAK